MAPPAKRQKRNVIPDDEDEDASPSKNTLQRFLFSSPDTKPASTAGAENRPPSDSPSPSPSRKQAATNLLQWPSSSGNGAKDSRGSISRRPSLRQGASTKSPSTSPEKARSNRSTPTKSKRGGLGAEDGRRNANLFTLFEAQAQKSKARLAESRIDTTMEGTLDDPIVSEDDEISELKASDASSVVQTSRKRLREARAAEDAERPASSAAQQRTRFLRPPRPPPLANGAGPDVDSRPWADRFGPRNLDELAVHKKKVADVRRWLDDVLNHRVRHRILILKGAAGTGKTTTLQLLANELGCEVLEWRNPTGALGAALGHQSVSLQFEDFLGRGGRFAQLSISQEDAVEDVPAPSPLPQSGRRVILIEEFPNTFATSSSTIQSFRSSIMQYLTANTPNPSLFSRKQPTEPPPTPIVMVISETLLTTASASADSFTAHRLLGPEILRHPGVCTIEFNAIAPSLLTKALELVVLKEARKSGRKRTPGPLVIKRLAEIGDIRNAVASLEFLCLKGDGVSDWGSKVAFTKPKRKEQVGLTRGEEQSLELISQREASLGIFHAVGKVVYNKRDEDPCSASTPRGAAETLPGHVSHCSRPHRSQVAVDTLIDETGTDTHTFISALHENYVLSCESPATASLSSLDYVNNCLEYLSASDMLCPSFDTFGDNRLSQNNSTRFAGSHVLRQDEMSFHVAVRGLLFALPYPVKRAAIGGRGGDAFKMFYPTSLKLWRKKEEIASLVDLWSAKMYESSGQQSRNLTDGAAVFRRKSSADDPVNGGGLGIPGSSPRKRSDGKAADADEAAPLISLGSSARRELLMDRLPFMAQIGRGGARSRPSGVGAGATFYSDIRLSEIEKVVCFQGVGINANEPDDIEDGDGGDAVGGDDAAAWATDKPTEDGTPRKKRKPRAGIARPKIERGQDGLREENASVGGGISLVTAEKPGHGLYISDDDIEDD